jgi:hypothetical protein
MSQPNTRNTQKDAETLVGAMLEVMDAHFIHNSSTIMHEKLQDFNKELKGAVHDDAVFLAHSMLQDIFMKLTQKNAARRFGSDVATSEGIF